MTRLSQSQAAVAGFRLQVPCTCQSQQFAGNRWSVRTVLFVVTLSWTDCNTMTQQPNGTVSNGTGEARQRGDKGRKEVKMVIVGDGGCGKTSLLMVYAKGSFPEVGMKG